MAKNAGFWAVNNGVVREGLPRPDGTSFFLEKGDLVWVDPRNKSLFEMIQKSSLDHVMEYQGPLEDKLAWYQLDGDISYAVNKLTVENIDKLPNYMLTAVAKTNKENRQAKQEAA